MTADFSGSVVAVTGAAGGIGLALAARMRTAGADLVLGDIDEQRLEQMVSTLGHSTTRTVLTRYDAASPQSNADFAALASDTFGAIDHLVIAAGIYPEQPTISMTDAQWRNTMAINLDGVMYLVRSAIPLLREGGSIVILTSVAGHRGSKNHAAYAASKGALIAFTRSIAWELAPRIRVNAVSPGIITTSMTASIISEQGKALQAATPLGRFGRADEVAGVISFLCSMDASFITGEVVHVNGGLYMA